MSSEAPQRTWPNAIVEYETENLLDWMADAVHAQHRTAMFTSSDDLYEALAQANVEYARRIAVDARTHLLVSLIEASVTSYCLPAIVTVWLREQAGETT